MYKIIRIIIFLISVLTYSQIEIKISPIEDNSLEYLKIDIYNNSIDYYAIPLDTLNLSPFDNNFKWKKFDNAELVPGSLSLTLYMKEKNSDDYLSAVFKSPDINQQKLEEIDNQLSLGNNLRNSMLQKWRKKNKIDNSINLEKNFYLFNNIIILKPKQKLTINRKIHNEFRQKILDSYSMNYLYPVKGNTEYEIFIQLDAPKDIKKYLTKKQRNKFNKFKIFEGQITSNLIPYRFAF